MAGTGYVAVSVSTLCVALCLCIGIYTVSADTEFCIGRKCKPDSNSNVRDFWERIRETPDGSKWLPTDLDPLLYVITLEPDFSKALGEANFTYSGSIAIYMNVTKTTAYIILNIKDLRLLANDIDLEEKNAKTGNWRSLSAPDLVTVNTTLEMVGLQLESRLDVNKVHKLRLHFESQLWPSTLYKRRVFWSKYTPKFARDPSYVVATHFSPTDARTAFPCFDEPRFKVPVQMNIRHPALFYKAVTNMPIKDSTTLGKGGLPWLETEFETTPPMPSYLIAFSVFDFLPSMVQSANPKIQVFVPKGENTPYMKRYVADFMNYMQGITSFPYQLPKLDIVGLPELDASGMENWGLINMRLSRLSADPETSGVGQFARGVTTLAHEIAHQWFGNVLTQKSWSEVWLKEATAVFYQHRLLHHVFPTWSEAELHHSKMRRMMEEDTGSNQNITMQLRRADQIDVFSNHVYSKAGFLLYMLEQACTTQQFDRAMKAYVKNQNKSNDGLVEGKDFWNAFHLNTNMTSVTKDDHHADVHSYMRPWFEQSGYPVVTLAMGSDRTKMYAWQAPMEETMDPPKKKKSSDDDDSRQDDDDDAGEQKTWPIPLFFDEAHENLNRTWIFKKAQNVSYKTTASKLLHQLAPHGFYRVNFTDELWERLRWELLVDPEMFTPVSRAHYVGDIFAFVKCCHYYLVRAMEVTQYILEKEELHPLVWEYINEAYKYPVAMLRGNSTANDRIVDKYMSRLLADIYWEVRWTTFGVEDEKLRQVQAFVQDLACRHGNEHCIANADYYFDYWLGDNENGWKKMDPSWRDSVFCRGVSHGGERAWRSVLDFALSGADYLDDFSRQKLLENLACSADMAEEYARMLLYEDDIEEEDRTQAVNALAETEHGMRALWEFYIYDQGNMTHEAQAHSEDVIEIIAKRFKTREDLNTLRAHFGTAEALIKRVEYNIGWLRHNQKDAIAWMEVNASSLLRAASLSVYILIAAILTTFLL